MIGLLITGIVVLIFAVLYLFAPKALIKGDEFLKRNVLEGKMTQWTFAHHGIAGSFFLVAAIILFIAWRMTK